MLALSPGFVGAESGPRAFDFALIGDYPYFERDDVGMPYLLEDLRAEAGLRFVLHLGDLHNPRATKCSEELFRDRFEMLEGLGHPFVLTPSDNDWVDCDNDPLGHLETLRRIFFSNPNRANGRGAFRLRSQSESEEFSDLVENAIWEMEGVVFATLHMISPSIITALDPYAKDRRRLIEAGEAWLDEVFRVAQKTNARGVLLATQVSLWPIGGNPAMMDLMNPELLDQSPAFGSFKSRLVQQVRAFGRPVVLANGDSHYFRIDKPLIDADLEQLQTFTRVEGFGTPNGHWVRVHVDPDRFEVFSFRQELVEKNLYTLVPREQRRDGFEDDDLGWVRVAVRVFQTIPKVLATIGALALLQWAVRRLRRRLQVGRK
jgi:hypothetical protein